MGFNDLIKLNIQKFAGNGCTVSVSESTDIATNASTFTITATVTTNSTTYNETANGAYVQGSYSGGASGSLSKQSFKIARSSSVTKTWVVSNVPHNSDGTLGQITFSVTWYVTSSSSSHGTTTKSINPATIPRYANITSFTVSQRDETSVTYAYSADASLDYARYSIDGVNFYDLPNSGVVGGLNSGTGYNFYLQVRRTDSQLWTTSWAVYQETYNYPYVEYVTDFVIGSGNCQANLINPLRRQVALQLISNKDGSEIGRYDGTYSGLVGAEFNTSEAIDKQYRSIPNDPSTTYYAKVTFGSIVRTSGSKTYYVDTNVSKPDFNLFTWEDINATTLALTGDSSRVVKGQSNIQATISVANKATPKNYASITKYEFRCGNVLSTDPMAYSDNADVTGTIPKVSSNTFEVRAVDSRGLPSDWVTLVAQNFIQYENLTKGTATIHREGEVGSLTTVTFDGKVSLADFGLVQNSVTNVTYQYKTASDTDYTTGETTITPTVDDEGNFTFTGLIKGDTPDGFDPQNVYSVLVNVFDELSNPYITFALTLQSGKPHLAWYKNGLSVMGKYDETVGGSLQIDGIWSIDKREHYIGSQILYDYISGTTPTSKTALLGSYRYTLIDGIFKGITIPSGYHKEYRLTFQGRTAGTDSIIVYLNNIQSYSLGTYSDPTYRVTQGSPFFKESDIVLEPTLNYTHTPGINLYYSYSWENGGQAFEIYNITVHGYIVKD